MNHQHKILWAINSDWGSLKPLVGSRGNAPVGGEGGCKAPLPKMGFRVARENNSFSTDENLKINPIIYNM
jgi:hypothetical protein